MEAIAIGDLHYDGHLCQLVDNFNSIINKQVQRAVDWGRKRGIDNVILLGDVGHTPTLSYEAQGLLLDLVLDNHDMKWWIILGNHDKIGNDSSAGHSLRPLQKLIERGMVKNVRIFEEPTKVKIDGAPVQFLPWPAANFSDKRLNIAHIEVKGSKLDSGRTVRSEHESDAVIVSGHLHTAHRIRNTHYTGTLYQDKFGMSNRKGFHHLQFNSVSDYNFEWIPQKPFYELVDVLVSGRDDLAKIPDDPRKLVRLIVQDGSDVDVTMWAAKTNVVKVSPFKTKEDLVAVLTEDLEGPRSLRINVVEYLKAWLEGQSYSDADVQSIIKTRARYVRSK